MNEIENINDLLIYRIKMEIYQLILYIKMKLYGFLKRVCQKFLAVVLIIFLYT